MQIRLRPYFFMALKIVCLHNRPDYTCNTYILGQEGEPALVIDPGNENVAFLDNYLKKHHNGKIQGVFITHGHFDHIGGLSAFIGKSRIFISARDVSFVSSPKFNLSFELTGEKKSFDEEGLYELEGDETLCFDGIDIQVFDTPFHTPGSLCFYCPSEKALFSGDTLFHLSVGRTDLPLGDEKSVVPSLRKLLSLPKETIVYPGHGQSTTIENELRYNPYLLEAARSRC